MTKIRLARELLRNGKKRGEWAELVFAYRAMERGFGLWRPWGETCGYDWVVEQERGGFARMQVKSTMFPEGEGYSCSLKDSKGVYKKKTFDFVAAYAIPADVHPTGEAGEGYVERGAASGAGEVEVWRV